MHWFYFGASYSCYFAFSLLLLLKSTLAMVLIYLIVSMLLFFQCIYFSVWAAYLLWILFRCLLEGKKFFGHLRPCFYSRFLSQFLRRVRLHRYASEKYRGTLAFASCICGPVAFLLASVHRWQQHCNASSDSPSTKVRYDRTKQSCRTTRARIFSYSPSTIDKVRAESLAIFYVIKPIVRSFILLLLK